MAKLVILSGPAKGLEYRLGEMSLVGRLSTNEIPLQDLKASRQHSRIFYEQGDYYIEDLGSRNGTLVNEKQIQKHKITQEDTIKIGDTLMQLIEISSPPTEKKAKTTKSPPSPLPQQIKFTEDILSTQPIEPLPLETITLDHGEDVLPVVLNLEKKRIALQKSFSPKKEAPSASSRRGSGNAAVKEIFSWDFAEYPFVYQLGAIVLIFVFMAIIFWVSRWLTLQIL